MNKRRGWTLLVLYIALMLLALASVLVGSLLARTGQAGETVILGILAFLLGFALGLGSLACYAAWFATQNSDMNRVSGARFETLLWTILLLIPVANWASTYKFADHIQKAQLAVGVTGMHPVALFLLMFLLGFIGHIVAQIQMDKIGG